MTDTKTLSETFNKKHKNVIRKLESLGCSEEFGRLNLKSVEIIEKNAIGGNVRKKHYRMTRDGFSLVVMGFTGKRQ